MTPSITERRTVSASPPPTASLNSRSPEKSSSSFTMKTTWSSAWPGVKRDSTRKPRRLRVAGHHVDAEPLAQRVLVLDVVGVGVSAKDGSRREAPALDRLEQRLDRCAGVDEERVAALLRGHHVGVREVPLVHAPFDQQGMSTLPVDQSKEAALAGLMSRAGLVIKAKFSKFLDRAEDPGETLDYSYEKQLELLQNVKRGIADVVTAKKRLQLQTTQLEQSLVKLDEQARTALAAGREDLARQALERKSAVQQQLQGLDGQVAGLEEQQEKLVASEKQLSAKIEAFRSQKEVIKAQYSAAEAQVRIGEAATGIGEQMADTGLAIQRAKDKTEQMQARAGAVDELMAAGTLEDFTAGDQTQLDRELAQLASQSQVDQELAKMKAELGTGTGAGAGTEQKELEQ